MRKGTVRSSRLSMKHDQFYHDNDQLAFYKCSVVNILVSVYWHQHTAATAYYYSLHTITSYIWQTWIPNGPFSQSWSHTCCIYVVFDYLWQSRLNFVFHNQHNSCQKYMHLKVKMCQMIYVEILANFATCSYWRKFYHANCVKIFMHAVSLHAGYS